MSENMKLKLKFQLQLEGQSRKSSEPHFSQLQNGNTNTTQGYWDHVSDGTQQMLEA